MTREEQLRFCKVCKHRKMNIQKGLLCGLTNEFASFTDTCHDFEKDVAEETRREKTASPNSGQITTTAVHPKPYWTYFGYVFLAYVAVNLIFQLISFLDFERNSVTNIFFSLFYEVCIYTPIWVIIGLEFGRWKDGLITAMIGVLSFFFIGLTSELKFESIIYILPIILMATYFGYRVLRDSKKVINLIGIILLFYSGTCLVNFGDTQFPEHFAKMLNMIFNTDFTFYNGFFTFGIHAGFSFDSFLIFIIEKVITFAGITFTIRFLKGDFSWSSRLIELGRNIGKKKMALYVFCFYIFLFYQSLGILGNTSMLFRFYLSDNLYDISISLSSQILETIFVFASIGLLFIVTLFYRKLVMEYYLDNGRKIGWGYYFSHLPIIGFFVWIYNFITFENAGEQGHNKIQKNLAPTSSLRSVLVFLVLISAAWNLFQLGYYLNAITAIPIAFGVIFYILYLYNPDGIKWVIGIQLLLFLIIFIFEFLDKSIPADIISRLLFWSLAQAILCYPVFHGGTFKIKIFKEE